jgi:hypothetical protein
MRSQCEKNDRRLDGALRRFAAVLRVRSWAGSFPLGICDGRSSSRQRPNNEDDEVERSC